MHKVIKDYVCFDLETTGFGKTAEIIEIGAIKVRDGTTVDKFSELVKPTNRISGVVTALTGISQNDVADARNISEVLPDFLEFIGNDILLGHNIASFDIPIVRRNVAVVMSANTIHYIITADHGFIYKRDKLSESDKISGIPDADRRYALTDRDVQGEGVASLPFSSIIGADDSRRVYFPMGSDLFKKQGSGLNYTHGGSSPQEMIIPLIDVRTEKGRCETTNAEIRFISLTRKITNLVTVLDFMQTEPVSDVVKETRYHVYFVDEKGNRISNECIYIADKKDADTSKRIFKLRFSFRNIKYDINKKYYLVAFEEKTSLEVLRHEMMIDIAFADDFGF